MIKYPDHDNFDIFEIKCSYARAVGFAQFMPTNILSIANDLRHHGWRPGLEREAIKKVLRHYNRSTYYANIPMRIYDRLKEAS